MESEEREAVERASQVERQLCFTCEAVILHLKGSYIAFERQLYYN